MTFSIPDQRGFQPLQEPIVAEEGLAFDQSLRTDLPLDEILSRTNTTTGNKAPICLSTNPGRYLCNYLYFQSMVRLQKQCDSSEQSAKKTVLFIHIPLFTAIEKERQYDVVKELIGSILYYSFSSST